MVMMNAGFLLSANALATVCIHPGIPVLMLIGHSGGVGEENAGHATVGALTERGDGFVDRTGGEMCETDAQCETGQQCTSCQCEPVGPGSSTTTTTLPGLQASDFMMFSGVETADPLEVRDETGGGDSCMPVTSPVRTGAFACQIAMNAFTALRPVREFEFAEMFARVYHRIDVLTPPAAEAFADRRYEPDGTLRSRKFENALIRDPEEAAKQALNIVEQRKVIARDGSEVPVNAQTICIHGDTPGAQVIAATVARKLREAGVALCALSPRWS